MLNTGEKLGQYKLVKQLFDTGSVEAWLAYSEGKSGSFEVAVTLFKLRYYDFDLERIKNELELPIKDLSPPHRNILSILEVDIVEEGLLIISEYASGGSLNKWLKANNGIAPSVEKAIDLTIEILKGLEHLHSKEIIHGNINLDNVLFSSSNDGKQEQVLKINLNFLGFHGYNLGQSHFLHYRQPFFLHSREEHFFDRKNDLLAVGVVLYQLLSGNLTFHHNEASSRKDFPVLPTSVPKILKEIVYKSLGKHFDQHYLSAKEMREALEHCRFKIHQEHDKGFSYSSYKSGENTRCTLLLERMSDTFLVKAILKSVNISEFVEIKSFQGKHELSSLLEETKPTQGRFGDKSEKIAILVDSNILNISDSKEFIKKQLKIKNFTSEISIFCAIPSVDAWLFADDQVAKKYAKSDDAIKMIERLPLPELISYPKQVARKVFGKEHKYIFLENINIERATARSSSLRDFIIGISSLVDVTGEVSKHSLSKSLNREIFASLLLEVSSSDKVMWKTVDGTSFTAKDLLKEINEGSETGKQYISDLLRIARDLVARKSSKI